MNILINNENIDFTLDKERNALDVYRGIAAWLESQDYYISEISLDGREIFIQNKETLKDYAVDSISRLEITALDRLQLTFRDLDTVRSYFRLYAQALKENNVAVMEDLGNQYSHIRTSLPELLMMNDYVFDTTLNRLMDDSGILKGAPAPGKIEEVLNEWSRIETLIEGRMGEISRPADEGLKTSLTLKRLIPRIEEVSLLFQSGKDREALDIIIVLTELLSKSVRILSQLSDKGTELNLPSGFIDGLNSILSELAEAIDSGDTILTGDLAEYEIIPKIETLEEIFRILTGKQESEPC
ncbi:MAG: hypothetical protein JXA95_02080 [Spirochaetales bacterium]|nr:hypothetical protein [Spirochaetales bacterium]